MRLQAYAGAVAAVQSSVLHGLQPLVKETTDSIM